MNEISRLQPPASTRVDDFLKRGEEVYNEQRSRVLALEAEHQKKRTEIITIYARRVSDLAHESTEALRRFDAKHRQEIEAEEAKLAAIRRLRG